MDPIADMLTRVRNANQKMKDRVDVPFSKLKFEVARILKEEGFVANVKSLYPEGRKGAGVLRIFLKYTPQRERVIKGLHRVSRSSLRKYAGAREIKRPRQGGFGVTIVSTSSGVMTGSQAREKNVGGEILCQVW